MKQLVDSSRALKHAIDGGTPPVASPASSWSPSFRPRGTAGFPAARVWALHLAACFDDDAAGTRHFRRALETSAFA